MPNSSDIEDIFAATETGPSSAVPPLAAPETSADLITTDQPPAERIPIRRSFWRRYTLRIAIVAGSLLVLVGLSVAAWYWWPERSAVNPIEPNEPPITTNTTAPITTTNEAVNTNTATQTFVDIDHDGLSDQEELIANTNPKKKDTDEDGLSDREEVRVYLTDPRNADTDGDGYTDGKEVANFYHPNHPDPKKRLFDLPK